MQCPSCRTDNPDSARFCFNCGATLSPPRPVEGERRLVSVLFADVVGSTTVAERLDPEVWAEVMNGAFAFMNAAVTRYGGTVGRLMGDGVLAFFGAPVAHEDDAERAVLAGLDIARAAAAYGTDLEARNGLPFAVRVGVNTGLTVLTVVGDDAKAEYTAMGDAANVAARLQALARPNSVLIGPDTLALVKHAFEVTSHGEVGVAGRSAPVVAFEVVGLRSVPGRARGLEGVRSPLVGRDAELEAARRSLARLPQGHGGVLVVVGEAGLGKSRLVAELREDPTAPDLRWLEGRAPSYARAVPYYPMRQVILASIEASESDPPDTMRRRLEDAARRFPDLPSGDVTFLEAVLAVEDAASREALAAVPDHELVVRIADATVRYAHALARERPTVIVFEDLHWSDPATVGLLAALAELVTRAPLLIVCVTRPERDTQAWAVLAAARTALSDRYLELALGPLANEAASRLLDNLLDVDGLSVPLRDIILQKSDGNPFFIEEVVRSLIDAGHVVREGERWRAEASLETVTIPDTLIGLLSARIDRLPDDTRRVAQTAAVIGRAFTRSLLEAVIAASPPAERTGDVSPHLATLLAEELLRERARDPEPEYVFKHALTRDAAYQRLLLRRRRELHLRVGEVLERLHQERCDEIAPLLAHHFTLGEAYLPAARHAVAAAGRSLKLSALLDALEQFRVALVALDHLTDPPLDLRIDANLGWADASVRLRHHERPNLRAELLERLQHAVDWARSLGDDPRLVRALVAQGNALALSGLPWTGFDPLLEAHDLARALGDDGLFLLPYWAATESMINHDPRGAAQQFAEVVAMARRAGNKGIEAHALGSKAVAHARLGEFEEADRAITAALEVAPASASIIKEADVNILAGAAYLEMGDLTRGLEHSRIGTDLAREVQGLECVCSGLHMSGLGKLGARELDGARSDLAQALEVGRDTAATTIFHQIHAAHATARLLSGEQRAIEELEAALADAHRAHDAYGVATIEQDLAGSQLRLGRPERATEHITRALEFYRDRGMTPAVARALSVLAEAHEAAGRHEEAALARDEAAGLQRQLTARPPHHDADGTTKTTTISTSVER
jgi:class 3 adenylate cyclase/tetratricopeptide (TPR) repeat protein